MKGVDRRSVVMNGSMHDPMGRERARLNWLMLAFSFGIIAWIIVSH
jgi:hypothetical protein